MYWGTPMFGNVTALVELHVTGKYRDMQHTCPGNVTRLEVIKRI